MKIVIDARESGTSTGRYIDKLVEYLHKLQPEYQITIVTHAPRTEFIKIIAPTFDVIPTTFKEFSLGEQFGFSRQLKALDADLVHFGMVQQPLRYKGKVVTTIHDLTTLRFKNPIRNWFIFTLKQRAYAWGVKKAAQKSAKILVPSQFVRNDVAQFTGQSPDKFLVTYESADPIQDSPTPPNNSALQNGNFIMYVGRPQSHKNLWRLIEAFQLIRQQYPDLQLALIGKKDALYEALERRVQAENFPGVVFTGFVPDGELRWLYEHARAYVFPSLSEGFGLPGLEAMAHNCPVVSSDATCLPEVYQDGAMYFDPNNTRDMAEKIQAVIGHEALRQELITRGQSVLQQYSWERMAQQTLGVYRSLLS
jgi:glycosyltransferase involved in cell wall biosynthesis